MKLREYQSKAISMLYDWFEKNHFGNPVLNMPGGSGKSVVIASIVKDALTNWPTTRVLMLVHSKELVEQNYNKLRTLWPNAPVGVYSASLNRRELGEPITYAGIGSVRNRAKEIGHIDLCLVDEAHAISTTETGTYRKLLADLLAINPSMRIVGLSASPFRLGQGMIHKGDEAIFTEIIEPVSIEELVHKGYLYPLRSKITEHKLSAEGLHKRNGEYIYSEMEQKFNTDDNNINVVKEIIKMASKYKHWLVFCSGINHSENVAQCFRDAGIAAESLTSIASKNEREQKLADFESGKIRALCNVGILTTGYDFQDLDCIVFLRATMSPGLYLQMAVRGMRPKKHINHALVLDFAGVVEQHGPITAVEPPNKAKQGDGQAPTKTCEECGEIVVISTNTCPSCEAVFPVKEKKELKLSDADIMGLEATEMTVIDWHWQKYISKASGKHMLSVRYYSDRMDVQPITEFFPVLHDGYAGHKSRLEIVTIAQQADASLDDDLIRQAGNLNKGIPPTTIKYKRDGKYNKVVNRIWTQNNAPNAGQLSRLQTFIHKNREDIYNPGASNAKLFKSGKAGRNASYRLNVNNG